MQTDKPLELGASYRLLEIIGSGATGVVWKGVHKPSGETIAAKILRREHGQDAALVSRFLTERSILTALRGPAIVGVRDLVAEGDVLAIVMDYVPGCSLRDSLIRWGPCPPALAAGVTIEILRGLAAAHEQGVVHRDVKPDNVLLESGWATEPAGQVRLTDFGISRLVGGTGRTTTSLLGTPHYMAPELIERGECSYPADVYSAGITCYELLAGRTPFAGPGTDYTVANRHVTAAPPVLDVPTELWQVLATMLAKRPNQRLDAGQSIAALGEILPDLVDLPALDIQPVPESFAIIGGPATMIRPMTPAKDVQESPVPPEATTGPQAPSPAWGDSQVPDLGPGDGQTHLRPVVVQDEEDAGPQTEPGQQQTGPVWLRKRTVVLFCGVVALVVAIVAGLVLWGKGPGGSTAGMAYTATQSDPATPTGLVVTRSASYDPARGEVSLTITYASQKALLLGPFLEIVQAEDGTCAKPTWSSQQERNSEAVTFVPARCGWALSTPMLAPEHDAVVTATIPMSLPGDRDAQAQGVNPLQTWLDANAAATQQALLDPEIRSTAYPVQRLMGVQIVPPSRVVAGNPVEISVLPVWPGGADNLNPLYVSPHSGQVTQMLRSVAGGESGLRFSDLCAGALAVSRDGLTVTALHMSAGCQVGAQLGNFTDLKSPLFEVTGHDS